MAKNQTPKKEPAKKQAEAKPKTAIADLKKSTSKTAAEVDKDKNVTQPKIAAITDTAAQAGAETETEKTSETITVGDTVKYVPSQDERERYEIAEDVKVMDASISAIIDNKVTVKYLVRGQMPTQTGANYDANKTPGTWHLVTD